MNYHEAYYFIWRKNRKTVQVPVSDPIFQAAKQADNMNKRSANQQIEHWAKIGRLAETYPTLPYLAIIDMLAGIEQDLSGEIDDFQS